jgi:hypothetical protein
MKNTGHHTPHTETEVSPQVIEPNGFINTVSCSFYYYMKVYQLLTETWWDDHK